MEVATVAFGQLVTVPVIIAIVQAIKKLFRRTRWRTTVEDGAMLLAIVVGVTLGLAFSVREGDPVSYAIAGLLPGVAASKTYDVSKGVASRAKTTGTMVLGYVLSVIAVVRLM